MVKGAGQFGDARLRVSKLRGRDELRAHSVGVLYVERRMYAEQSPKQ